jgi:mono/diheme cytochrome c family protein
VAAALLWVATAAGAATYDGSAQLHGGEQGSVTGTLDVTGTRLAGTLSLTVQDARAAANYHLAGKLRRKRFLLSGTSDAGNRLRWQGMQRGSGFTGKFRLRGVGLRMRGMLVVGARAPRSTACDDVFRTEVMGRVLVPICATCHRSGGAADGTRLRVTADDAAATEATVAALIDASDPAASLLLRKPVGDLGHGGGAQLARDGAEIAVLRNWVDLVAQGQCGENAPAPDPNDPGAVLYANDCASCHGTQARGVGARPAIRCNRDVSDAVKQGRDGPTADTTMRPFPLLRDADIALIQGFLDGLCPSASATGADLFAGNCASCHGADALGGSGPSVRCSRNVHFAVENGVVGAFPGYMLPLLALSDPEIQKIQGHLSGLCTPAAATGAELFGANCAACHGIAGEGNGTRPDVRCTVPSRLHSALYYGRGFPVTVMPSFTPVLSAAEESRIASLLSPQCTNQGGALFASNCATCHGTNGQGGRNADGLAGPAIRCASSSDVFDAVVDGKGGMPAIADLTTGQINAIVTYLRTGC